MSLLQPLPINYQNAAIEQQTLKGIVHLATVLTLSYDRFWNLMPEVNELLGFVGRTPEAIVALCAATSTTPSANTEVRVQNLDLELLS